MPPDPKVQDILDSAIASVVVTGTSGLLANAGIILGIYFGTVFIATVSRALSQMHGVQEDRQWWSKYIISFSCFSGLGLSSCLASYAVVFGEKLGRHCRGKLATLISAPGVDRRVESAVDRRGAWSVLALALYLLTPEKHIDRFVRRCRAQFSLRSAGSSRRNFFQLYVVRYDRYNPTYLALASIHRAAHVDVSDLSAAVAGRQIERHHPARNVRRCASPSLSPPRGSATRLIDEYVKLTDHNGEKAQLFVFCNFFTNQCCKR